MFVPALLGKGRDGYRSLDRQRHMGFDGSLVAESTITPALLVHDLARRPPSSLMKMPIRQILDIFARAADRFETGQPDGLAPEEYVRKATLTSGLPLSINRQQTLGAFPPAMRMMEQFIRVQSPGGLDVFDSHVYQAEGVRIGFTPRGRNVGFVMPGNHPSTHFMWMCALAMKIPVVVRPSSDDVFTPYRVAMALFEAGLPEDALIFVPGGHDLVDAIIGTCALSVLFGGQPLADRYAANRSVRVHGPGRSKVVVLANADVDETVKLITRLVMDDAGRGCINGSAVVVEGDASKLAAAVAAALDRVPIIAPINEDGRLGSVRPREAAAFNSMVDLGLGGGAAELTASRHGRVASVDGVDVMRPTVISVTSFEHPLFGMELPFPFVVFASAARHELALAARHSLAVVVAGRDPVIAEELLMEPTIDKVFAEGALSTEFDPREPHEGFLVDFLYMKKTLRSGVS